MNERFKALASDAGIDIRHIEKHADEEFGDELEKFAQLIVDECARMCWSVSEAENKGYTVSECAKAIRKHFGVEV